MDDRAARRVAMVVALLFLAPAVVLMFSSVTVAGRDCGTFLSPEYSAIDAATDSFDAAVSGSRSRVDPMLVADECASKLGTRQTLWWVLMAVAVVVRLGLPYVVRQVRPSPYGAPR